MCRKCEEMSCFGSLGHVGNLSFDLVLSVKDARLKLKRPNLTRKPITQYILTQERTQLQSRAINCGKNAHFSWYLGVKGESSNPVQ